VTDAATASGIEGNEELTAWAGLLLIPLLVVVGVTLFFMRQLIVVHLFVGLVLVGPVCLKLASAGYRFTRYYTREPRYRRKGPPPLAMRLIAPIVVVSTVVMLVSGVLLLIDGPSSRDQYLELHKVSCIVWVVFVGLHVLGHLAEMPSVAARHPPRTDRTPVGRRGVGPADRADRSGGRGNRAGDRADRAVRPVDGGGRVPAPPSRRLGVAIGRLLARASSLTSTGT
jgi:uncharacterized membrane protein